jgi:hypothetical protein
MKSRVRLHQFYKRKIKDEKPFPSNHLEPHFEAKSTGRRSRVGCTDGVDGERRHGVRYRAWPPSKPRRENLFVQGAPWQLQRDSGLAVFNTRQSFYRRSLEARKKSAHNNMSDLSDSRSDGSYLSFW